MFHHTLFLSHRYQQEYRFHTVVKSEVVLLHTAIAQLNERSFDKELQQMIFKNSKLDSDTQLYTEIANGNSAAA